MKASGHRSVCLEYHFIGELTTIEEKKKMGKSPERACSSLLYDPTPDITGAGLLLTNQDQGATVTLDIRGVGL